MFDSYVIALGYNPYNLLYSEVIDIELPWTRGPKEAKAHVDDAKGLLDLQTFLYREIQTAKSLAKDPLIVCIGTDRSTGDALGPLIGTHLEKHHSHIPVHGTLAKPVHAVNLEITLASIYTHYKNPYILAVDACLGKHENIGVTTLGRGSLRPGAGVHKDLPMVGDLFLTGTVNVGGFMEYMVLQNTRLHLVMTMAEAIADLILRATAP